jgi:hypothetical protein
MDPCPCKVNTRAWLTERSRALYRQSTLDDAVDTYGNEVARPGSGWAWLLSARETDLPVSPNARALAAARVPDPSAADPFWP